MTWRYWSAICLIPIAVGVVATVTGQVAAVATCQFARGVQWHEQQAAKDAADDARTGRTDGAGPGAGLGLAVAFLCCVPFLFPVGYALIAAWVLLCPISSVRSKTVRAMAHLVWAGWCGGVVVFCMAFAAAGEVWGPLQWEWPGFWLQSVGSWALAVGHAAAALWQPVRD